MGRGKIETSQMKASSYRGGQSGFLQLWFEFAPHFFTATDDEVLTLQALEKPLQEQARSRMYAFLRSRTLPSI